VIAYCLIVACGLSGVILAIGKRVGYIRLQWDEKSKKSLLYKMQKVTESMNPRR